ncbi:hypothetical protein ACH5RR_019804 [Cinchona calisaya]|uniref:Uncharacterized protein n=1 Tax=Cinchona calisaya TaxID=153742 RepID=A0ABD2ZU02_9GENT
MAQAKPRPKRGFGNSFQPAIDAPRLEPHKLRHCPKRKDVLIGGLTLAFISPPCLLSYTTWRCVSKGKRGREKQSGGDERSLREKDRTFEVVVGLTNR